MRDVSAWTSSLSPPDHGTFGGGPAQPRVTAYPPALLLAASRASGLRFNEHLEGDGPTVFADACKLGLEGIVPKRKDSAYRSGRSLDWLKMKNVHAPAVKREEEDEWGKKKWR